MTLTRAEVAALLRQQNNIVILTHCGPDGDTLGSAALLCRALRAMGKWAWILENPEIREKYDYLVEGLTTREAVAEQLLICVDGKGLKVPIFVGLLIPLRDQIPQSLIVHVPVPVFLQAGDVLFPNVPQH